MLAGVSDDDEVRARDIRIDDEGRPVFTLDFGQGETIDTMLAIPACSPFLMPLRPPRFPIAWA
ncbi:MAG: hypothetical protein ACLU37_05620 [Collinsella sp.]